jgi:hypothetical protein
MNRYMLKNVDLEGTKHEKAVADNPKVRHLWVKVFFQAETVRKKECWSSLLEKRHIPTKW